jgi:hypothetical protein
MLVVGSARNACAHTSTPKPTAIAPTIRIIIVSPF